MLHCVSGFRRNDGLGLFLAFCETITTEHCVFVVPLSGGVAMARNGEDASRCHFHQAVPMVLRNMM